MYLKNMLFMTCLCLATGAQSQSLPEGEGRQIVAETCGQCHELGIVTGTRRTHDQWQYVVSTMISMGAPLPEDQVDTVVTYLAKNFGQSAGTSAAPAEK